MSKTSTNQDIINHIYKKLKNLQNHKYLIPTQTKEEISLYKEEVEAILDKVSSIELIPSNGVMDRILNCYLKKNL